MKKKLWTLAIMAFLAGLTALAGAQTTSTRPRDDKKAAAHQMATPDVDKDARNGHAKFGKNQRQQEDPA